MINLISNSTKFSRDSNIYVITQYFDQHFFVIVKDFGSGINE